jgi:hypothetical protein
MITHSHLMTNLKERIAMPSLPYVRLYDVIWLLSSGPNLPLDIVPFAHFTVEADVCFL